MIGEVSAVRVSLVESLEGQAAQVCIGGVGPMVDLSAEECRELAGLLDRAADCLDPQPRSPDV